MQSWKDAGIKLRLYISISGDFVALGTRTDYPFQAGGAGGVPVGWTQYASGGPVSELNWTTSLGRFSMSTVANPGIGGHYFGIERSFPLKPHSRLILNAQCQTMENRDPSGQRGILYRRLPDTNYYGGLSGPSTSPWEPLALYTFTNTTDTPQTVDVRLYTFTTANNFGVQFQNFATLELPEVPAPPVWHEVTCDIKGMAVTEGRERATGRYEVGSMNLTVVNDDGEYSYQPNHPWGLRPGRFVKVEAEYQGTTWPVYYGVIDGLTHGYSLDGHVTATMACVDVSSLLSTSLVPTAGTSEYKSGLRWRGILDVVGWHPNQRWYEDGVFVQQGVYAKGSSVREELGLIADSEGSTFWTGRQGILFYYGRDHTEDRWSKVNAELLAETFPEPTAKPYVHFVFPYVTNNYIDTPHQAALNALTDLEITVHLSIDNLANAGTIVQKSDASLNGWWLFKSSVNPRVSFRAGQQTCNSIDLPYIAKKMFWLRARYVAATRSVSFFFADDSATEPNTWTQLGTTVGTAQTTNVATTVPMSIGGQANQNAFGGRIADVIVRGANGAILFETHESDAFGQAGALAYTSSSKHPMTVHQTGTNVIIRDATVYDPLPDVDGIPDISDSIPIICTKEMSTSWSRDRVVNEVSLANQNGSAFTQVDVDSQTKYGPRTYQRMDLVNSNSFPEYLTTRIADVMAGNTEALVRINTLSFRPKTEDDWTWVLQLFMQDLVRVRYQNPLDQWGFSAVAHIQGFQHAVSPHDWIVTLSLDDYKAYNYWTEGAQGEGWDLSTWDDDLWDGGYVAKWTTGQAWSDPSSIWGA